MRYVEPWLHFYRVATPQLENILAWMEVITTYGAEFWSAANDRLIPREEWAEVVGAQMQEDRRPLFGWRVSLSIRFMDMPETFLVFSLSQFDNERNQFEIGTLLDFEFRDERPLVEPVAQRTLELGRTLYLMVHPWVGSIEAAANNPMLPKDAVACRLKHIAWVNWFGPVYVERYGRDFLLGLPGFRTEPLPDGGVFHQLSPTFVAPDAAEAQRLQAEVIAYARRHGRKVSCRAPLVIPGLTRLTPPEAPLSDAELMVGLEHLLATTLVLDDGVRLKHLVIPWERLQPWQRAMTVARLKQALIAELRQGGRLRLEFNAIPTDLEQMLIEVAGTDNPDITWTAVGAADAPYNADSASCDAI